MDDKLTWAQHISEGKKSFVKKLNLLNLSSFLPHLDTPRFIFYDNLNLCFLCVADMGKFY